jgi:hypothetical protein
MSKEKDPWYFIIFELATHFIVGIALFLAVMLPAVIIYKTNEWLVAFGIKGITMWVLYTLETILLLFDFYSACRYIYRKTKGH